MMLTLEEVAMPSEAQRIWRPTNLNGYVEYYIYDDAILLHRIFIAHTDRSEGQGSKLLEDFLTHAVDPSYLPVILRAASDEFCSMDDEQLMEWYKRHGFKEHAQWGEHNVMVFV